LGGALEGAQRRLEELLSAGEEFTYENFATKSQFGYPDAFTAEWIAWKTRVGGAIERLFGESSPPVRMIRAGDSVGVIGEGKNKFEQAKSYYLGALKAALEILEQDTFGEVKVDRASATAPMALSNKVFVVHGHDEKAKQELEILLTEMGLEPIVLHRQADGGRTLIEKFEHYSDVGFAFILMTPDEVAYLIMDEQKPDQERGKERRARPNVIFEFGFFVGRLGRAKTCCLYRGDVVVPSDLSGLIYKRFEHAVEETAWALARELKAAGYVLK
jgi:predicted nucleotide-binding protein